MWAWDWTQWETHVDWMVLNGINMPLAITGQEKTWQETFKLFHVSSQGLDRFLGGAAYLAWERMGNIRGDWSPLGRLPQHFIDAQHALQLKLLSRYREFGMLPALPAFAGHVPDEMRTLYPSASMRQSDQWAGFDRNYTCVYMLDPTDPLYRAVGKAFLTTQQTLYGGYTSSLYSADTYNELLPHTSDHAYLRASSNAVIESMLAVDPNAVWLMQAWLFISKRDYWTQDKVQAYLAGVPNHRMLVLDLNSSVLCATKNYYGKDWVFCVLHTFGGNLGLHGNLPHLASAPIAAKAQSNGTMVGLGLTMEGIFQNYVVYDLSLDMNWQSTPLNVSSYVTRYVRSRYHVASPHAQAAWTSLTAAVYSGRDKHNNLMTFRPRFNMLAYRPVLRHLKVRGEPVRDAWRQLLDAATAKPGLATTDAFTHDLVDVARQGLSDLMSTYYETFLDLYHAPTTTTVPVLRAQANAILTLMWDCDRVLATHPDFLLGRWIADAKRLQASGDAAYFEFEARVQITTWSLNDILNDYARKEWAGVVGDYYLGRWHLWLQAVVAAFAAKRPVDDAAINDLLRAFEHKWLYDTKVYPTHGVDDPVAVAAELWTKYYAGALATTKTTETVWSDDSVTSSWPARTDM
ncbi:hypothetical protein SPRG_20753 [Saprolegnia parasitica CBS 223.65]|uniref:Alpha-N-acetylglucosaminidase C-terminal domain-containing protein n=1 Tax=Saprolegnia parasitica (strain CBS 223.65) TaxID=695850 RepID=A0A067C872_SAPPC|nr:hypothetical protein SPRG_20753 [Saprolegnia parasitica CBS 223.65]KDO25370.1 hypothetical protein SPRG_20753 [Saprolegnia parasitica CBS 223.65]|eukprot:XP_012203918.1 hypothetical protein SPRG_20753 [Saprolegnia parasitica CBS 223.65]